MHNFTKLFLKASIGQTHFKCQTENCKCKKGQPHSAHYLSYRKAGQTYTVHIPKRLVKEVKTMCQNWRKINKQVEIETDKRTKKLLIKYKSREQKKE